MQGINAMDAVAKALRAWVVPYSVPLVKTICIPRRTTGICVRAYRKLDRLMSILGDARQFLRSCPE